MEKIIPFPGITANSGGFDQLVRPHMDYLFRLAYRFAGNQSDAEDLVQEVLIKVYEKRAAFAEIERQRAWLARVTYNTYVDGYRALNRSPLSRGVGLADDDEETAGAVLTSAADTQNEATSGLNAEILQQALDRLDPDHRALVALHDIEGYTLGELERLLDCPLGTLKSRLHRARAQLRGHLKKFGTF